MFNGANRLYGPIHLTLWPLLSVLVHGFIIQILIRVIITAEPVACWSHSCIYVYCIIHSHTKLMKQCLLPLLCGHWWSSVCCHNSSGHRWPSVYCHYFPGHWWPSVYCHYTPDHWWPSVCHVSLGHWWSSVCATSPRVTDRRVNIICL